MTAVSLAIRYISVAFNVYITNRIGASAMGLFTLVSSVYGFTLTLATSGISLATTKLVSEAIGGVNESDRDITIRAIMKKSLLFSFAISFTISVRQNIWNNMATLMEFLRTSQLKRIDQMLKNSLLFLTTMRMVMTDDKRTNY